MQVCYWSSAVECVVFSSQQPVRLNGRLLSYRPRSPWATPMRPRVCPEPCRCRCPCLSRWRTTTWWETSWTVSWTACLKRRTHRRWGDWTIMSVGGDVAYSLWLNLSCFSLRVESFLRVWCVSLLRLLVFHPRSSPPSGVSWTLWTPSLKLRWTRTLPAPPWTR